VVNQALAKRDFKGANPVGRRFYVSDSTFATIVGVVSDIRNVGPFAEPAAEMYWTYAQSGGGASSFPVMIRTHGDPTAVEADVRRAIHDVDPTAAVSDVATMSDVITHSLGQPRFYMLLLMTFAVVALALTIAGLYGVLSYVVSQRTRELGIRAALGSSPRSLVKLVALDGVWLVVVGMVVGFVASGALTRLAVSIFYGVSPVDAATWALAAASLATVAIVATVVPAMRASQADPVVVMRAE
jgi:predicted lysophospholipase L1 biosynthesis ABC-type transport system permease subunit